MGQDWYRVRVKIGVDQLELRQLVSRQARAFRALYCTGTGVASVLQEYRNADSELRQSLEFPEWDANTGVALDDSALRVCFRTYPVTRNPVFPPEWRSEAMRTILPDELPGQLAAWRQWLSEVKAGQHRHYLERQANDSWLNEFLVWAEACCAKGFGLFLDG